MPQDNFSADSDAKITISGGKITVDAKGDGLDSNGSLCVSGGEIFVTGPSDNDNGALDITVTHRLRAVQSLRSV